MIGVFRAHKLAGWRRKQKLFGKPDFVFRTQRVCVFVDGCFWHGCPQHATKPGTSAAFWRKKFAANKARDLLVNRTLRKAGWRVVRIWEHELKMTRAQKVLRKLRTAGLPVF